MMTDIFAATGFYIGLALKTVVYAFLMRFWFRLSGLRATGLGVLRTLFGALVGVVLLVWMPRGDHSSWPFYAALMAARVLEWYAVSFRVGQELTSKRRWNFVSVATLVSVFLDLFVVAGWISTGAGIC